MGEPCKKCGSTNLWCDCCVGCGGLHMFRDCPGHDPFRIQEHWQINQEKLGKQTFHNEIMAEPVPPLPEAETGSRYIKKRLKELDMEKRGVVLDDEKTKTAGQNKRCPKCGATMNEHSYCSSCGTEPFEKRDDNGSSEEGS